jgi:hypothetical protein
LLAVVAIVSVCLAIGGQFAGLMLVLVAFGLIQAGMLLAAGWLIRPQNRKWLAIVTAVSWTIVGSGLLVLGTQEACRIPNNGTIGLAGSVGIMLIVVGVFCYGLAFRRWRQLAARNGANLQGP